MNREQPAARQVIAMHGWAGDARCWAPWRSATQHLGWYWQCGERGYGGFAPQMPGWREDDGRYVRKILIGHSLGPHLVPASVLQRADIVVLLAGFAAFVPSGREGRRTRAALAGMRAALGDADSARTMLRHFMNKVAEPQPPELLPPGPVDGPLEETNRARLREDLDLLAACDGLPGGFPQSARVLIVEAEEDRIVEPSSRAALRSALPQADVIGLPGLGHALLDGDVIGRVVEWAENGAS